MSFGSFIVFSRHPVMPSVLRLRRSTAALNALAIIRRSGHRQRLDLPARFTLHIGVQPMMPLAYFFCIESGFFFRHIVFRIQLHRTRPKRRRTITVNGSGDSPCHRERRQPRRPVTFALSGLDFTVAHDLTAAVPLRLVCFASFAHDACHFCKQCVYDAVADPIYRRWRNERPFH